MSHSEADEIKELREMLFETIAWATRRPGAEFLKGNSIKYDFAKNGKLPCVCNDHNPRSQHMHHCMEYRAAFQRVVQYFGWEYRDKEQVGGLATSGEWAMPIKDGLYNLTPKKQ